LKLKALAEFRFGFLEPRAMNLGLGFSTYSLPRKHMDTYVEKRLVGWLVGLFLLLPLGALGIRETLRFTSVS
jgi:hypothetical protein